jgi:hypothetical protein
MYWSKTFWSRACICVVSCWCAERIFESASNSACAIPTLYCEAAAKRASCSFLAASAASFARVSARSFSPPAIRVAPKMPPTARAICGMIGAMLFRFERPLARDSTSSAAPFMAGTSAVPVCTARTLIEESALLAEPWKVSILRAAMSDASPSSAIRCACSTSRPPPCSCAISATLIPRWPKMSNSFACDCSCVIPIVFMRISSKSSGVVFSVPLRL